MEHLPPSTSSSAGKASQLKTFVKYLPNYRALLLRRHSAQSLKTVKTREGFPRKDPPFATFVLLSCEYRLNFRHSAHSLAFALKSSHLCYTNSKQSYHSLESTGSRQPIPDKYTWIAQPQLFLLSSWGCFLPPRSPLPTLRAPRARP